MILISMACIVIRQDCRGSPQLLRCAHAADNTLAQACVDLAGDAVRPLEPKPDLVPAYAI